MTRTRKIDPQHRERARQLRLQETPIERRLWKGLRALKAQGFHFRRQAPIGPYVADFACLSSRFVVEADGESHGAPGAEARDSIRDAFFRGEGFRVLRVSNREVMRNLDGVVETVLRELGH